MITFWKALPTDRKCSFIFFSVLSLSTFIWFVVPSIFMKHCDIDSLEAIMWGANFQFGYNKNPYFPAFITFLIYVLSGGWMKIFFLASSVSNGIGIWAIWKLARKFLPSVHALIAALLLLSIDFYASGGTEFNDNAINMALWPLTTYCFYMAIEKNTYRHWFLVGLFAGLALMTKYLAFPLLLGMFIFTLTSRKGRECYKTPAIYSGLLIFMVLVIPHLIFLYLNDFTSLKYAVAQADIPNKKELSLLFAGIFKAKYFICDMILPIILPILLITIVSFVFIGSKKDKEDINITKEQWSFIFFVGYTPVVFLFLYCLLTSGKIVYLWLSPLNGFSGILLICLIKPYLTSIRIKTCILLFLIIYAYWGTVFVMGRAINPYLDPTMTNRMYLLPGSKIADFATNLWHKRYNTRLKYAVGDTEIVANMYVFSSDHPAAFVDADTKQSPWINMDDFKKNGGIFIFRKNDKFKELIQKEYPDIVNDGVYSFPIDPSGIFKNILGHKQLPDVDIMILYLPPAINFSYSLK